MIDRALASAAARYRARGGWAGRATAAKLEADPIYGALLARGLGTAASVLDLGCGRGAMLAAIAACEGTRRLHGIDASAAAIAVAREVLGDAATLTVGNLVSIPLPPADAVLLLDVLHYLPEPAQDALLARARGARAPPGRLVLREADASGGARFLAVRASERAMAIARGEPLRPLLYRQATAWREALVRLGLRVEVAPMGAGTPFANVVVIGAAPDAGLP